jgi:hypothetical protein
MILSEERILILKEEYNILNLFIDAGGLFSTIYTTFLVFTTFINRYMYYKNIINALFYIKLHVQSTREKIEEPFKRL